MGTEEHDVYIMHDESGGEWVSPTPARTAILHELKAQTDLGDDDFETFDTYLDIDELDELLNGDVDDSLEFTVEGHDVMIDASGEIIVAE